MRVEGLGTPNLVALQRGDFIKHGFNDRGFCVSDGNDLLGIGHVAARVDHGEGSDQIVIRRTCSKCSVSGRGDFEGRAIVVCFCVFQHRYFIAGIGHVRRHVGEVGKVVVCDGHGLDLERGVPAQVCGQEAALQNVLFRTAGGWQRVEDRNRDVFFGRAIVCGGCRRVHEFTSARQHDVRGQSQGGRRLVADVDGLGSCGGVAAEVLRGKRSVHGVFAGAIALLDDLLPFSHCEGAVAGVAGSRRREGGADFTAEHRIGGGIQHRVNLVDDLHGLGVLGGQSASVGRGVGADAGEFTGAISIDERFRHGKGCGAAIVCGNHGVEGIQFFELHRAVEGVVVGHILKKGRGVVSDVDRSLDLVKIMQVAHEKLHHGVVVRGANGGGFLACAELQTGYAKAPID